MSRAFEELASEELDALYQGALFLSAGDPGRAEQLLIDAVTLAFKEHAQASDPASVEPWLEDRLVRTFLRDLTEDPTPPPRSGSSRVALDPKSVDAIGAPALFEAAAALPSWARAALWLVLFRRRSYTDAAKAMGVDPADVPGLLEYRDLLIEEMITSMPNPPRQLEIGG